MRSKVLVGLVSILFFFRLSAQVRDCEAILNEAAEGFAAGHFNGIAAHLDSCLTSGFSREQQQRAYLLLVQTYLILDDPIGARSSYLKLLQANPEFIADPLREPIDVVYLSKKFTATPVFTLFAHAGGNVQRQRVIYQVLPTDSAIRNYTLKTGFQLGGGVDWNINDNLVVSGEANYAYTSYVVNTSGVFKDDNAQLTDHQHWLDIPLSLKYVDHVGDFRPYGYLGYSLNLMFGDVGNFAIRNNKIGNEGAAAASESVSKNLFSLRNMMNRSLIVGFGIRLKVDLNYLFADLRYSFGHTNITNGKYFYEGIFNYIHVDDYFRVDRMALSFGYMWPLYRPRELKRARTKGVLRSILKERR